MSELKLYTYRIYLINGDVLTVQLKIDEENLRTELENRPRLKSPYSLSDMEWFMINKKSFVSASATSKIQYASETLFLRKNAIIGFQKVSGVDLGGRIE